MSATINASVSGSVITVTVTNGDGNTNAWVQINFPTDVADATAPPAVNPNDWSSMNGTQVNPSSPIPNATLTFPVAGVTLPAGTYEARYYPSTGANVPARSAQFAYPVATGNHVLTINKVGTGTGTVTGAGTYPNGTVVTPTETPNSGSVFAGWSIPVPITMDADKTEVATFNLASTVDVTITTRTGLKINLNGTIINT